MVQILRSRTRRSSSRTTDGHADPDAATSRPRPARSAGAVSKAPDQQEGRQVQGHDQHAGPPGTKASGKVTVSFTKGKTSKTVTGTLKNGTVTVTVPKLAKGTWKVTVAWAGDTTYQAASASGASIKVTK